MQELLGRLRLVLILRCRKNLICPVDSIEQCRTRRSVGTISAALYLTFVVCYYDIR